MEKFGTISEHRSSCCYTDQCINGIHVVAYVYFNSLKFRTHFCRCQVVKIFD